MLLWCNRFETNFFIAIPPCDHEKQLLNCSKKAGLILSYYRKSHIIWHTRGDWLPKHAIKQRFRAPLHITYLSVLPLMEEFLHFQCNLVEGWAIEQSNPWKACKCRKGFREVRWMLNWHFIQHLTHSPGISSSCPRAIQQAFTVYKNISSDRTSWYYC